jgi:predicted negative regulator of RcsB-dependent stress response
MFWWRTNGKKIGSLVLSLIIGLGIFKYCQHHRYVEDQMVAGDYQTMSTAMFTNDLITVKTQGAKLIKYSNRTPYPRLAALFLAKAAFVDNDLDQAVAHLRWVINNGKQDQLWHIANLRLIKLLLLQNKLTEVETIKNNIEHKLPKGFTGRYQELFGDFLLAKNQKQEANMLYREAIQNLPQQISTVLLDLKVTETDTESN